MPRLSAQTPPPPASGQVVPMRRGVGALLDRDGWFWRHSTPPRANLLSLIENAEELCRAGHSDQATLGLSFAWADAKVRARAGERTLKGIVRLAEAVFSAMVRDAENPVETARMLRRAKRQALKCLEPMYVGHRHPRHSAAILTAHIAYLARRLNPWGTARKVRRPVVARHCRPRRSPVRASAATNSGGGGSGGEPSAGDPDPPGPRWEGNQDPQLALSVALPAGVCP